MSISFGGLSSGVDTSSWIEALVATKQASLKSLEQKRETLLLTTNVLENIKSFFSSFQGVLLNITNSNLGIKSTDLFIQNIVESSNASAVTASANTEAQEAVYDINVNQLATETQATSSYVTTIINETEGIATGDSLLSSLGINSGVIEVLVDDSWRDITIQSNDTINTFIEKLDKIGVTASYDDNTGIFKIDIDADGHIRETEEDYDKQTHVIEVLSLQNVNSGYVSNDLFQIFSQMLTLTATNDAKMSLFGVTETSYDILKPDGSTETFTFNPEETTFGQFFDMIALQGLDAKLNEDGSLTIVSLNGNMLGGALAEQLGLSPDEAIDASTITTTTTSSTNTILSTENMNIEYTTTFGEMKLINDGDTKELTISDEQNNLIKTVTFSSSATVNDLFDTLRENGITAFLSDNVITFDSTKNYVLGGTLAEAMGIEKFQSSTTTLKSGNTTESTGMVSYVASETDWVSDCLWDVWDSYSAADKVITVKHTYRINPEDMSGVPAEGIYTKTGARGNAVNYTLSIAADHSTATEIYTYTVVAKNSVASDGSVLGGTQFQDIEAWYKNVDGSAKFEFDEDGHIYIDSSDNYYMQGTIAEYLGITEKTYTFTWVQGNTSTDAVKSTENITYRLKTTDYLGDVLWDNGYASYSASDKVIQAYKTQVDHVKDSASDTTYQKTVVTLVGTFTVKDAQTSVRADGSTVAIEGTGTTMQDIMTWYTQTIDTTASFIVNEDGSIYINSENNIILGNGIVGGKIQDSRVIKDLGVNISTFKQTWTTGLNATESSSSVTYTIRESDTLYDTLYSKWDSLNKTLTITQGTLNHNTQTVDYKNVSTFTVDKNTNYQDVINWLAANDITLSMNNGVFTIQTTENKYVTGDVLSALGFNNSVNNAQYTWTYGISVTGSTISYYAHDFDKVSDFVNNGTLDLYYFEGIAGNEIKKATINAGDMTFGQLFSAIASSSNNNINVSLNSTGQMVVNCSNGWYIRDNNFGISVGNGSNVTYTTGSSGSISGITYKTSKVQTTNSVNGGSTNKTLSYTIGVTQEVVHDFDSYTADSTTSGDAYSYHDQYVYEYDSEKVYEYDDKYVWEYDGTYTYTYETTTVEGSKTISGYKWKGTTTAHYDNRTSVPDNAELTDVVCTITWINKDTQEEDHTQATGENEAEAYDTASCQRNLDKYYINSWTYLYSYDIEEEKSGTVTSESSVPNYGTIYDTIWKDTTKTVTITLTATMAATDYKSDVNVIGTVRVTTTLNATRDNTTRPGYNSKIIETIRATRTYSTSDVHEDRGSLVNKTFICYTNRVTTTLAADADKPYFMVNAENIRTIWANATSGTSLGTCGISGTTVEIYDTHNGTLVTSYTLGSGDSFSSLANSSYGISVSVSGGVVTLSSSGRYFATCGLTEGRGLSAKTEIFKIQNNADFASGVNISDITSGFSDMVFTETVDDGNGGVKTVSRKTVSATDTLGNYVSNIDNLSYASASLSNGVISYSTNNNYYSNQAGSFFTNSYRRKTDSNSSTLQTQLRNSTMLQDISNKNSVTFTYTRHTNNTYSSDNTTGTVTWNKEESLESFIAKINAITGLSASVGSGQFTVSGSEFVYISSGNDFANTLKLGQFHNTYNYGFTYQKIDGNGAATSNTYRTASATGTKEYATLHLGGTNPTVHSTTLENLNINSNQTISIVIHTNNTYAQDFTEVFTLGADGTTTTITRATNTTETITVTWTAGVASTNSSAAKPETLQQFIDDINAQLAAATARLKAANNLPEDYNIAITVDNSTGKIKFQGDEYTYIDYISDDLENALKISENVAKSQHYEYTLQYSNQSNSVVQDTYVNMLNTKLMNFDVFTDQVLVFATNNNISYSADMTKNGTVVAENTTSYYTVTWKTTMTLGEFANELNNFGSLHNITTQASEVLGNSIYSIGLHINDDKTISLTGNEYTYITAIGDALEDKFKIVNQDGEGHYFNKHAYDLTYNNVGNLTQTNRTVDINGTNEEFVNKIQFSDNRWTKKNTTLLNYDTRLNNFSIFADMTMTIETPDGGKSIELDHDTTMQELKERLFNDYGIELTIEEHTGKITLTPTLIDEGYYILGIDTQLKNALKLVTGENGVYTLQVEEIVADDVRGTYKTQTNTVTRTLGTMSTTVLQNYSNSASDDLRYDDNEIVANRGTKISALNGYEKGNGKIAVNYSNGEVLYISIRDSWTLDDLVKTNGIFDSYGIKANMLGGGRITLESTDGTYLSSVEGGSNLLDVLNLADFGFTHEGNTYINSKTAITRTIEQEVTVVSDATTKLSDFDDGLLLSEGIMTFVFNGKYKTVTIKSDETFGSFIDKLHDKGVNAKIENGKFTISSGYDSFSIVQDSTTSNIMANKIFLSYNENLGGYSVSGSALISRTTTIETKTLSTANFADKDTTFGTFNIASGSLSVYKDGQKVIVQVSEADTAQTLQNKLRGLFGQSVSGSDEDNINVSMENGSISIYQNGSKILVGSNEDSSNFAAITGILSDSNGVAKSTRDFFKVNDQSRVTDAGLFRNGTITAGTFIVGDATITVEETSTIADIVNQINTNSDANAVAYWNAIDGEFVIKAKNTGSYYINIQAGTSNFTDILGFTKTSRDADGNVESTNIIGSAQSLGKNSRININGVTYSSNSNVLGSESTGIKGLTINLKDLTTDSPVQLTVKKDVQTLSNTIQDILDAYNTLMENINLTLSSSSALKNDSTLKLLKNQLKTAMTGNNVTSSIFKNLASVGITTSIATAGDISTGSNIFNLSLNVDKFVEAFENDATSVRTLLIGKVDEYGEILEEGIFNKIENIINYALDSANGFFARKEASLDKDLDNVDNKITKGNEAIEKYRERLERKFMSMDLLVGDMKTQYNVYFK